MAISPISTGGGISPLNFDLLAKTSNASTPSTTAGSGASSFGNAVTSAIDNLDSVQKKADNYALQAATGTLTNVEDYMTAATDAQLTTQLTVAVRNKAVEAFQEIMRMQV
jgi:flagellar hook-basal body complex protein FliE